MIQRDNAAVHLLHLLRVGRKQALGRREGAGGQPRTALLAPWTTLWDEEP